jgi:hypothetical protein
MKKIFVLAACMLFLMVAPVFATTYPPFTYTGSYLSSGLLHQNWYTWGMNIAVPANEDIVSGSITFYGLKNWNDAENHLYVNFLGDAPTPITFRQENMADNPNDNTFSNYLSSWNLNLEGNIFVHDFSLDYVGPADATSPRDVTYSFDAITRPDLISFLNSATSDGLFGLGFDPDCSYTATKIKLKLISESGGGGQEVPEPGTFLLISVGLLGLGLLRKK